MIEGPRDRGPLHLAAGQLARLVRQPVRQADAVEQFRRPVPQLAPLPHPAEHRVGDHHRHQHVFQGRQLRQQMVELEDEAEDAVTQPVALLGGQVVDALAVELDLALVGLVQRAEQVQQRALARARSCRRCSETRRRAPQVDALEHRGDDGVLAVSLVQPGGGEQRDGSDMKTSPWGSFSRDPVGERGPALRYRVAAKQSRHHSYRSARTGCSSAARSAGRTLNSTAMATAPRLTTPRSSAGCRSGSP